MLDLLVTGVPVPQPRPHVRAIPLGGGKHSGQAYVPKKHKVHEWRALVRSSLEREWDGRDSHEGPVMATLVFHVQRPLSHYGTGRNAQKLKSSSPKVPTGGRDIGDIDNYSKAVLDELAPAGVLKDDKQVIGLHAFKQYAVGQCGVIIQLRDAGPEA